MQILTDHSNSLLHRRELTLVLSTTTNPGLQAFTTGVAEQLKVSPECVVVTRMAGSYGKQNIVADVFVYESVDMKNKIQRKPKVKKEATK